MSGSFGPNTLINRVEPGYDDPADFTQRGAIIAFTTPHLLGARIFQAQRNGPRELSLPGLSMRSAANLLPWSEVATTQAMTLHDQELWERLRQAGTITPLDIRSITLALAADGWRGGGARGWARDLHANDRTCLRRIFFLLLTDLIRRTEWPGEEKMAPEDESLSYLRPRIGKAIGRISKALGMKTAAAETAVETLAGLLLPFGKPRDFAIGYARHALQELRGFAEELNIWVAARRGSPRGARAEFVLRKLGLVLCCAEAALEELDKLVADATKLLGEWHRDPAFVSQLAGRVLWLLDGWDIVIALWRQSEPSDREACLWEISHLTPLLPQEVEGWKGFPEGGAKLRLERPPMFEGLDWRSSQPQEFTARNEQLLCGAHALKLNTEARKLREAFMVQTSLMLTGKFNAEKLSEDSVAKISKRTSMASDTVLRQVVAVLEALPSRAELDPIIEAARPRLKILRPPRLLTFTRVLFLPFDGAVVDAEVWHAASATFPRPALTPIAEAIREAMGKAADEINVNLGGRSFFDVLQVDSVGRNLWVEAARLAPQLRFPKGLAKAGLNERECRELLQAASCIWRNANEIWEAKLASFSGPSAELVINALKGPAQGGPVAFGMALLSVLHQAHSPGSVLTTAARLSPIAGNIADNKLEELQNLPLPALPVEDPVRAAHLAEEYVTLLKELETAPPGRLPNRREVTGPLLEKLGTAAEIAATAILEQQFLPALDEPNEKRRAATILNIEHLARSLRRLEDAGRRAGRVDAFNILQQRYVQKLRITARIIEDGGFQVLDITRIAEILLGPDQARALAALAA